MSVRRSVIALCCLVGLTSLGLGQDTAYDLKVFPPEHKHMKDPLTGVDLLFVTTHPDKDVNFYFHERSWLSDGSMLFFTSKRPDGGLMAYLFQTGELVQVKSPAGGIGGATAGRQGAVLYGVRGRDVLKLTFSVEPSQDPLKEPSRVTAAEHVICTAPEELAGVGQLSENSDGTLLSSLGSGSILVVDVAAGSIRKVWQGDFAGHLQFSRTLPTMLSFAGKENRLMVMDIRDGQPRVLHEQVPGELVTHECWWVNDTLTFCGGYRDGESAVKVIDYHTGKISIVGTGAWVPWKYEDPPVEPDPMDLLNRWNWWHACGDENGLWIAADNWYGDIVLFDAKTTQMHRLAIGQRVYSSGEHPHVGWDWKSRQVVFASAMLGNPDVCVATLPETWPPDPAEEGLLLSPRGLQSPSPQ